MTDVLRTLADHNGTKAAIAEIVVAKAKEGDIKFIEFLFERIEGKVKDVIEQTVKVKAKGYIGISPDDWDDPAPISE
mgnify:CR=1 FL=1